MPARFDVLVAGEINPDLILSDPGLTPPFGQAETLIEDAVLTIGSSSAIFACAAARLGLRVVFVGLVGDDAFGRTMLDALHDRSVDTSNVVIDAQRRTGFSVILNRGADRAILTYAGASASLSASQISNALLSQARHLHVASYFLQIALRPDVAALFKRAQRLGLSTSLDTNWDPSGEWAGVEEALAHTTLFLPNAPEALAITGASDEWQAAACLSQQASIAAIKMGAVGAIALRGAETASTYALPIQIVDTVGAGDTFDAGFVYGHLQGWSLERCLQLGVVCGSLSTRACGGVDAQPTLDEALAYVVGSDEQADELHPKPREL
jgi:sugar/nucleoside kinase (ribokinase family)